MLQSNKIRPYYNEFNKKKCQAMALLMAEGIIPDGDIDDRPIQEVKADDVKGYTQCHFFAGWGGWAYALGLAGWPDGRPVWTGSCPCQPFSSAGRQKGKADERHLWPVWFGLIRQSRPPVVFGEQVSSAIRHHWWDDVADGMEGEGYTTRAEIRPACCVGAPHRRERLWFVANAESARSSRAIGTSCETSWRSTTRDSLQFGRTGYECSNVADAESRGRGFWESKNIGTASRKINAPCHDSADRGGKNSADHVADSIGQGSQGHGQSGDQPVQEMRQGEERYPWTGGVWIDCPDGKQRLVKPGIQLLADGYPNRRLLLHIAGDSIVPQVAAAFIGAYMDARP